MIKRRYSNTALRALTLASEARWFPITDIIRERERLLAEADHKRFCHISGGRRALKTETAKRYFVKKAITWNRPYKGKFFFAAPTWAQAKRIFWDDLLKLTYAHLCKKEPNKTECTIYLDNGCELQIIGLDKPSRFEGTMWTGGVIDEIDDIKPLAWQSNIKPALDSKFPDGYQAQAWLVGTPNGRGLGYQLRQQEKGNSEWGFYKWSSAEFMHPDVIAAAKRSLSPAMFLQEYEGLEQSNVGIIYSDYSDDNTAKITVRSDEQLIICCDQNYSPCSSAIIVRRKDSVYIVDEVILHSAESKDVAEEFCFRYSAHEKKHILLYGDPSGKNGEKHGLESAYVQMEAVFKRNGWTSERRIKRSHDGILDRINSLRALIKNAAGERRLFVDATKAKTVHAGLLGTKFIEGSQIKEDPRDDFHHVTTALGYFAGYEFPVAGGRIINLDGCR